MVVCKFTLFSIELECQIAVNIQNLQEVKSEHAVQINDLHKQLAAIKLEASKWKHTTLELEKNILSLQKRYNRV